MNKAKAAIPALLPLFAAVPMSGQIVTISPGGTTSYDWDVDSNGIDEFRIKTNTSVSGTNSYIGIAIEGLAASAQFWVNGRFNLINMGASELVSGNRTSYSFASINKWLISNQVLATSLTDSVGPWSSGVAGYTGFRFESSGNTHYGWAQLVITAGASYNVQILDWSYNTTPDAAIQVGQTSAVPEPAAAATGLGLLALGVAGLRRQRWLKRNRS